MRKPIDCLSSLGLAAALALQSGLLFSSPSATAADAIPIAGVESTRLWFIELNGPPTAEGSTPAAVRAEKDTLRRNARARGIRFQERRSFDTLWNGLSVSADPLAIAQLRRLEGVKAVFPVIQIPRPDSLVDDGSCADLATAVSMTGADVARSQLGYSGAGIRVGVIDTGIDVNHPLLGGSGVSGNGQPGDADFPNLRVVTGYDFVGDAY
ncbi:MAG: peptidase S8, partial [Verrucomicrobiota bacterium]